MRIQHNIMAMNAYRNYTNNVNAMKANLEKLSSGYKINRAGDDAAGLAISEKMRAQITGLETAQKNAKDGISLVQTAEGALTEVHDMLNRMVELATQSANGTYDNTTDRAQLQKELEQLNSEINRIADSSNFNGIKLLDGSMDASSVQATYDNVSQSDIMSKIMLPQKADGSAGAPGDVRTNTILETNSGTTNNPSFQVSFDGVKHVIKDGDAASTLTLNVDGKDIVVTEEDLKTAGKDVGDELTAKDIATAFLSASTGLTNKQFEDSAGNKYDLSVEGNSLKFTMTEPANKDVAQTVHFNTTFTGVDGTEVTTSNTYTAGAYTPGTDAGTTGTFTINATDSDGKSHTFTLGNLASTYTAASLATNPTQGLPSALSDDGTTKLGDLFTISVDANGKFEFTAKTAGDKGEVVESVAYANTGTSNLATYTGDVTAKTEGKTMTTGTIGYVNGGSEVNLTYTPTQPDQLASTTLDLTGKLGDGTKLTLGDTTYVIAKGEDSAFANVKGDNIVVVKVNANDTEEFIASKLTEAIGDSNETFTVSHQTDTAKIGIKQKEAVKATTDMTTMEKFASYIGLSTVRTQDENGNAIDKPVAGRGLTLQIGDTADTFNQLTVNIKDMHAATLGIDGLDISTQDGAATAIDKIKSAINMVSDVRGTLGATQNRLDHTINNLSVMTENIQDAESTIRDTDVAEEMMAYTKNNILIQSAQAMLAQANQVPQGVLQLLQ